jgi:hypothetical protein
MNTEGNLKLFTTATKKHSSLSPKSVFGSWAMEKLCNVIGLDWPIGQEQHLVYFALDSMSKRMVA